MDFDGDVELLLMFGREVNSSVKMRDIEFEVRRLLKSPDDMPPGFQHPQPFHLAQEHDTILTEQLQSVHSPQNVVMEVAATVLEVFWWPPPSSFLNTPSHQLSKMVVSVAFGPGLHCAPAGYLIPLNQRRHPMHLSRTTVQEEEEERA